MMLSRLVHTLWLLVVAGFALLLILFSVANRQDVAISLHPLPWEASMPLFAVFLICIFVGYLFGIMGALRVKLLGITKFRKLEKENDALRMELAGLKAEAIHSKAATQPSGNFSLPAPDSAA